ncbi:MAG: hypothetical protein L6416_10970 [Candidatus Omnitrophica bacterium]|nr:hypothetical protein [Candidatus Omnitrophota bacterium]
MNKLFRLIAFVLIQAFLVMDCAWCGTGRVAEPKTLNPQVQIGAEQFQTAYSRLADRGSQFSSGGLEFFAAASGGVSGAMRMALPAESPGVSGRKNPQNAQKATSGKRGDNNQPKGKIIIAFEDLPEDIREHLMEIRAGCWASLVAKIVVYFVSTIKGFNFNALTYLVSSLAGVFVVAFYVELLAKHINENYEDGRGLLVFYQGDLELFADDPQNENKTLKREFSRPKAFAVDWKGDLHLYFYEPHLSLAIMPLIWPYSYVIWPLKNYISLRNKLKDKLKEWWQHLSELFPRPALVTVPEKRVFAVKITEEEPATLFSRRVEDGNPYWRSEKRLA